MAPVLFSPTTLILSRPPPEEYDLYESIISGNIGNVNNNEDNCYHVLKYNTIITLYRVVIEDGNANYEYGGLVCNKHIKTDIFKRTNIIVNHIKNIQTVVVGSFILVVGAYQLQSLRWMIDEERNDIGFMRL
eukprot:70045_1